MCYTVNLKNLKVGDKVLEFKNKDDNITLSEIAFVKRVEKTIIVVNHEYTTKEDRRYRITNGGIGHYGCSTEGYHGYILPASPDNLDKQAGYTVHKIQFGKVSEQDIDSSIETVNEINSIFHKYNELDPIQTTSEDLECVIIKLQDKFNRVDWIKISSGYQLLINNFCDKTVNHLKLSTTLEKELKSQSY